MSASEPFAPLARALANRGVRYVLIGVSGANFYAPPPFPRFVTDDWDLFLPLEPANLVRAWTACDEEGTELWLEKSLSTVRGTPGSPSASWRSALSHA